MRKRNVDKHIWFDRQEAQDLQKKAKKACLTEAALIRLLIRGYEPREKPDERFYDAMRELSAIGNNINQIARALNIIKNVDAQEQRKLDIFQIHLVLKAIQNELTDLFPSLPRISRQTPERLKKQLSSIQLAEDDESAY